MYILLPPSLPLPPPTLSDVVECDLVFEGLIVMQNRLKPETTPVISTLTSAALRTVMITGECLSAFSMMS